MIADADNHEFMSINRGTRILCNGVEINAVVYADDETGIVVHLAIEGNKNEAYPNDFMHLVTRGKVEIILGSGE